MTRTCSMDSSKISLSAALIAAGGSTWRRLICLSFIPRDSRTLRPTATRNDCWISLADAETGENFSQQIVGGNRAGDFSQALLSLPQFFCHEFAGSMVRELAHGFL